MKNWNADVSSLLHKWIPTRSSYSLESWFPYLLLIGIGLNGMALFSPVMDQDSALYAGIAKRIALSGDWINLMMNGEDWLDKPHLPFWFAALSFKLFGISAFTYKLPSFLCWLIGVWYIYRLTLLLHNKVTAQLATLIFITSLHVLIANYDVRAEGYLTTFIVAALYSLYRLQKENKWIHVVTGALFCAMAIQTKGIFALITIASGFIVYWICTRQWSKFINLQWLSVLLLTLLFILPELYCLYVQFELHPEKMVFGQQHVSGIRFFLWESQFGRFFNTGPIKGHGDPLFFMHTTLWAFLPWSLVLIASITESIRNVRRRDTNESLILAGSALVTFIVFSASRFQLPHYIVILFPHFSIFTATWLLKKRDVKSWKILLISSSFIFGILIVIIGSLLVFYHLIQPLPLIIASSLIALAFLFLKIKDLQTRFIWKSICFALLASCFIQRFIYSEIMQYNAGKNAALWINEQPEKYNVVMLDCLNFSFNFYLQTPTHEVSRINPAEIPTGKPLVIFCPESSLSGLNQPGIKSVILKQFDYYHISMLKLKFLDYTTRPSQVEKFYIIKCYRNPEYRF
jgi:4-amino-4-deoxy-L-arabinose transferase and related glycosyltransferases of PMT family